MITTIDEETGTVRVEGSGVRQEYPLASNEGFMAVSSAWLRAGWDAKYVYGFTWFGRPIIQLPDDLIRIQEVIYALKPDVIVETGVAHGGSLIFYASICEALHKGKVIGIDVEIRPHNRIAIERHELFPRITLVEGSSTEPLTISEVSTYISEGDSVLVILDSNHSRAHVLEELRVYGKLVTGGSYIVATDGIMAQVIGGPRTSPDWSWDNPLSAIDTFLDETDEFTMHEPEFPFNEGVVTDRVTYWPRAFLRKK